VFSIPDVWDTMRIYGVNHEQFEDQEVIKYIQKRAGEQFDPKIVNEFFRMIDQQ